MDGHACGASGMGKVDAVVARVDATMRAGRVPGLSIAVVGPQGVCWMRGFGVTDLVRGEPAGVRTPYLWFSMTKIVTATAVVRLAGIGALDLDGPVAEYFPAFAMVAQPRPVTRSEEHTSELQSRPHLVCRLLLEKKKNKHHPAHLSPHTPHNNPI